MGKFTEKSSDGGDLELSSSPIDETAANNTTQHDAVFGEMSADGPNYRDVGWVGTTGLMLKTQIGLGVLSIPAAFSVLGLIPGMICLIAVAIITTWSDYTVGVFKLLHPEVYGINDAGFLLFGPVGREILGAAYCLFYTFVTGSAFLGFSIGLNAVSSHGTCTAVFVAVGAILGFTLSSIRTLGRITWIVWAGVTCLIVAIFIVTIGVGVQDRPAAAPQQGPWASDYQLFGKPTFSAAVSAVSTIVLAYAGTPAFFALAAEMRDPHHYARSLICCQTIVTIIYITIAVVVYYFCGSYVTSPALGSAGPLLKKIAYGIALPGLVAHALLLSHLSAKYLFIRILRGSKHLAANTFTHWATWLGCTFTIALVAYLIASGVPVFSGLVSLIGALFGTTLSFQPMGCMWLYDNWSKGKDERSPRWIFMVCWSVFVIVIGTFLTISGTYGSIVGIIDSYKATGGSAAWSCADNSGTV